MRIWQIGTGEPGRDYSKVFFEYDLMIIGPSYPGDALKTDYRKSTKVHHRKIHHFAHKPKPGDRVLMRFGREVIGVGQIPTGKENQYSFDKSRTFNVYGLDLHHCRRVIWAEKFELGDLKDIYKKTTQMWAFTEVHAEKTVNMVQEIDSSFFDRPLRNLPTIDSDLYTDEKLGIALFSAGISNKNIDDIKKALQQAERLNSWYGSEHCGRTPSEQEIVSHSILPVFLGLGWSQQQIAVEWQRVDMAFFKTTPTEPDNCVMILEAKAIGKPLGDVIDQAEKYVRKLRLKNVKYLLTTDGNNLFVYAKKRKLWDRNPVGYLSVSSLQKEYILPKNTNAIKTLVRLQPSAV
jgi:hypothetical protein